MKKVMKVVIPVIGAHVILGTLFLQQGCTNLNTRLSPKSTNVVAQQSYSEPIRVEGVKLEEKPVLNVADVGLGDKADNAMNRRIRQEPRRPVAVVATAKLTPGYNKGLIEEDYTDYQVSKGDSLWLVARKHGTTVAAIVEANRINRNDVLKIGQTLKIPAKESSARNLDNPALSPFKQEGAEYVIQKGDSLSVIAHRFGVSVEELKAVNSLESNTIYAGKKVTIPGVSDEKVATVMASIERDHQKEAFQTVVAKRSMPATGTHKVQSGETLSEIAKSYGVSVNELMALNNIADARKLREGQQLIIRAQNDVEASMGVDAGEAFQPMLAQRGEIQSANGEMLLTPQLQNDVAAEDSLFDLSEEAPIVHLTSVTNDQDQ